MKRVIIILMIIITSFNVISANTFNSNENCAFKIALIKTITMVNPHDTFEEYGGFYQGDLKPLGIKNPEVIVKEYVPKTPSEKRMFEKGFDTNDFLPGEEFEDHFKRINRGETYKRINKEKRPMGYWNNIWSKV